MKHLKKFNEDTNNFEEELLDFCETNLAYILDEGAQVKSIKNRWEITNHHKVEIDFTNTNDGSLLWDGIKDIIIPFLIRLNNNYNVGDDVLIFYKPEKHQSSILGIDTREPLQNLINDTIDWTKTYRAFKEDSKLTKIIIRIFI